VAERAVGNVPLIDIIGKIVNLTSLQNVLRRQISAGGLT
jgi:hypothetical protein